MKKSIFWGHVVTPETFKEHKAEVVLRCQGAVIGTTGGYSYLRGKEGTRKTFLVSCMITAMLTQGEALCFSGRMPPNKDKVLYVDTEQSYYYIERVYNRIAKMSHNEGTIPNLIYVDARMLDKEELLKGMRDMLEDEEGIGYMVIDSAADLVDNVNEPTENKHVFRRLLPSLCEEFGIHTTIVLHENKGNTDGLGFADTFSKKGCESSARAIAADDGDYSIYSFKDGKLRSAKKVDDFYFYIDDDGIPAKGKSADGIPITPVTYKSTKREIPLRQHLKAMNIVFSSGEDITTYNDLVNRFHEAYTLIGEKCGVVAVKNYISMLRTEDLFTFEDGKYSLISY